MIRCSKCNKDLPEDSFSWKNQSEGKRNTICKQCHRKYLSNWYHRSEENKAKTKARAKVRKKATARWLYEYLNNCSCIDCGEIGPACLQFDHVRGQKEFNVCHAAQRGLSLKRIKAEIGKCEVRCANCHAKRTAKEQGWYESYK